MSLATTLKLLSDNAKGGIFPLTHTSLSGGKYVLWTHETPDFLEVYSRAVDAGCRPALVERRYEDRVHVLVDLDFRQAGPLRQYTSDHVCAFVAALFLAIRSVVQRVTDTHLTCYLLEKPAPRECKPGASSAATCRCYKDGLHLVIPGVVLRPDAAMCIREEVLPDMAALFRGCDFSNSWDDVYDASVLKSEGGNGWIMYGSKKPDEPFPWAVTSVLVPSAHPTDGSWEGAVVDTAQPHLRMNTLDLVRLMSVRSKLERTHTCTRHFERMLNGAIAEQEEARVRIATARANNALAAAASNPAVLVPFDVMEELVNLLAPRRARQYADWFKGVCAIRHSCHAGGLSRGQADELVHTFSRRAAASYDASSVDAWLHKNAFVARGPDEKAARMGTLVSWVREDAPVAWATHLSRRMPHTTATTSLHKDDDDGYASEDVRDDECTLHGWFRERIITDLLALDGGESMFTDIIVDRAEVKLRLDGEPADNIRVSCGGEDVAYILMRDSAVMDMDGRYVGHLMHKVMYNGTLSMFNHAFADDVNEYSVDMDLDRATFSSADPRVKGATLVVNGCGLSPPLHHLKMVRPARKGGDDDRVTPLKGKGLLALADAILCTSVAREWRSAYNVTINIHGDVNSTTNNNNNNNTSIHHQAGHPPTQPNEYGLLRLQLVAAALEGRLRKHSGFVFKPLAGCPCAYVRDVSYEDYINRVVGQDDMLLNNIGRFRDLKEYLHVCDETGFPKMRTDRHLLSFRNGVLRLDPSLEFVEYPTTHEAAACWPGADRPWLQDKTARHHIDGEYTGAIDTPLLDDLVLTQMPAEAAEVLYALMGRALFAVGTYDQWDIMPFLLGLAGTGKSTIVKVLMALFAEHTVGSMSETHEKVFGLEGKADKELLEAQDIPDKMSQFLHQQLFQKMVCGERVSVSKKQQVADEGKWTVPMVFAGNHFMDYKDVGGCISRRVVVFEFQRVITAPSASLLKRLTTTELPNIAARFLGAYFALVARHPDAVFWSFCPDYLKRTREVVRQETSYVARFLVAKIEEYASKALNPVGVVKTEDAVTLQCNFREAFLRYMRDNHPDERSPKVSNADNSELVQAGFVLEAETYVCKSCRCLARIGCCTKYAKTNRTRLNVIHGMELVTVTVAAAVQNVGLSMFV